MEYDIKNEKLAKDLKEFIMDNQIEGAKILYNDTIFAWIKNKGIEVARGIVPTDYFSDADNSTVNMTFEESSAFYNVLYKGTNTNLISKFNNIFKKNGADYSLDDNWNLYVFYQESLVKDEVKEEPPSLEDLSEKAEILHALNIDFSDRTFEMMESLKDKAIEAINNRFDIILDKYPGSGEFILELNDTMKIIVVKDTLIMMNKRTSLILLDYMDTLYTFNPDFHRKEFYSTRRVVLPTNSSILSTIIDNLDAIELKVEDSAKRSYKQKISAYEKEMASRQYELDYLKKFIDENSK